MKIVIQSSPVPLPPEKIFAGFGLELFRRLNFPLTPLQVIRFDGCILHGITHVKIGIPPLAVEWIGLNTELQQQTDEIFFVDEGQKLPFFLRYWRHKHRIILTAPGQSVIRDEVEFRSAGKLAEMLLYPLLWMQFAWRIPIYRKYFTSPRRS